MQVSFVKIYQSTITKRLTFFHYCLYIYITIFAHKYVYIYIEHKHTYIDIYIYHVSGQVWQAWVNMASFPPYLITNEHFGSSALAKIAFVLSF